LLIADEIEDLLLPVGKHVVQVNAVLLNGSPFLITMQEPIHRERRRGCARQGA
jgi:hypothetical protein